MIFGSCKIDERLYMIIDRLTGNHSKKNSSQASSIFSYQEDTIDVSETVKYEESDFYSQQIK